MFTLSEHPPLCVGVGVFPCLFSSRICLCSEMGDLGAAFSQFANQGTTASDEVVQDLEAEIDELRAQLQETEENLQDSRSTLAREREFAELINQDNEDAQQQQAELQQTLLRSQNLETEFKKSKAERAELQDQLQEAHEAAAALELQIGQLKDGLEQERDARHRQAEELDFANARSAELESTLMAAQSQQEVAQTEINELKLHVSARTCYPPPPGTSARPARPPAG